MSRLHTALPDLLQVQADPPAPATPDGAGRGLRNARNEALGYAEDGWRGIQPLLDFELLHVAGLTITVGGLIAAFAAVLATWVTSILARRAINRYGEKHPNASRASLYTVSRLVQYALLAVGILLALSLSGVPMGKFAIFAGALGVGLGLGLQSIFNNFFSGLILLFDKSLKVGDFVELESGVHGEVLDIKIRATTIVTNDNIDILVPNSEFVSGRVVSWTHREVSRRMRVSFGVAYGTDKETVKRAALEAAAEVAFTLEQEGPRRPQVWLTEFGESSLNYELVVWLTAEATKRPSAVKAAYNWALHSALARHGIEIPFPQQDLHVRSLFGVSGTQAMQALRLDIAEKNPDAKLEQIPEARNDAADDVQLQIDAQSEAEAAAAGDAESAGSAVASKQDNSKRDK